MYFGSKITEDARCTRGIKPRAVMVKTAFNNMKAIFFNKLGFRLMEETSTVSHLERTFVW